MWPSILLLPEDHGQLELDAEMSGSDSCPRRAMCCLQQAVKPSGPMTGCGAWVLPSV